jgi:hypothetical protein
VFTGCGKDAIADDKESSDGYRADDDFKPLKRYRVSKGADTTSAAIQKLQKQINAIKHTSLRPVSGKKKV